MIYLRRGKWKPGMIFTGVVNISGMIQFLVILTSKTMLENSRLSFKNGSSDLYFRIPRPFAQFSAAIIQRAVVQLSVRVHPRKNWEKMKEGFVQTVFFFFQVD